MPWAVDQDPKLHLHPAVTVLIEGPHILFCPRLCDLHSLGLMEEAACLCRAPGLIGVLYWTHRLEIKAE